MNIDLNQHPDLLHGCDHIADGALMRMTPELLKFCSINEAHTIRANCPSGVRIVLETDTRDLALTLKLGSPAREIYSVDFVIDQDTVITRTPRKGEKEFTYSISFDSKALRKIEIHLPHLCECTFQSLEIDNDAIFKPVEYPGGKLIFIGDSITQGMTSTSPSRCYAAIVAAALGKDWTNLSVGGATMRGEQGYFAQSYDWQTAFVPYGVNDFARLRSVDEFRKDTKLMLDNLSMRENIRIYLMTPMPYLRENLVPRPETLEDFRQVEVELAAEYKQVKIINGKTLLPPESRLFVDGLHPNDIGMKLMAKNLLAQMDD